MFCEAKEKKTTYILPTELGEKIIQNLGDCDICKVDLTGLWEEQLQDVRKGTLSLTDLEKAMMEHVEQLIEDIKKKPMTPLSTKPKYHQIAVCPKCGNKILSGEKGAFCAGWKSGCEIWLPKTKWGITFSEDDYKKLLEGEKLEKEIEENEEKKKIRIAYDAKRGLVDADEKIEEIAICPLCGGKILATKSRFYCSGNGTGKSCSVLGYRNICGAYIENEDIKELLENKEIEKTCKKDEREWKQKMKYDFKESRITFVQPERKSAGYKCPCCKKSDLYEGEKMYRCMDSKCGFTIWKTVAGHVLTDEELTDISNDGITKEIDDFKSKKGTNFTAKLKLNKRKKQMEFEFPKKEES